jgi:phosphate/sulfate permease
MNYSGAALAESVEPLRQAEFAEEALSKRQVARLIRDRERGYSINSKQIVLAFMVEFVIIGLILTNIYVTVAQLPDPSTFKTVQALLFPIAMAMVELARVKSLEFYLIFVSSIAAAFSSTLIAMTAVRRIKKPTGAIAVTIPDEAAAYLFGPLVVALRKEAADAVAAAASKVQRAS